MTTIKPIAVTLAFLFSAIAFSLSTRADDKPNDTVIEKLQGRWLVVSGVNQGRELSEAEVEGTYVTITTNTIVTYDRDQRQRFRAVFRTDEAKDPIHITMTSVADNASTDKLKTEPKPSQPVASGILKLDGDDEWTLCYGLPGADRPKAFESTASNRAMLFKLKKEEVDPSTIPSAGDEQK
ncbi:hypothetical protein Pla22_14330 [Rubripirellula amarantea]|uniref:TIGR03067 domain-containing protein n=1 Tax=Rubripirellula amarantea TaxID=2527999 RepID=A0A5C5WTG6_9BACT|nr:TIGR03067 domain-containing protein [Rubripirellula amarantea]TWT53800.1 hypothetical protein Pla22_14330 [Rubripirellula amarantea]